MRYESKIGEVLETISEAINETITFKDTPIFYDFIEIDTNVMPETAIVYKPLEWRMDNTNCHYERQLDIVLLITDEERREGVIGQLFLFGEELKKIIDELNLPVSAQMDFIQGSPVQGFAYNRKGVNSYKETPDLFTSMIVLSYLIRY